MNDEHPALSLNLARFGLPAIILIFYMTAILAFEYTPDSTYEELLLAKGLTAGDISTPGTIWRLLLGVGELLHLDSLLVVKVLSLLFSCAAILMSFLIAFEILVDRVLAFSIALVVGVQPWLIQLAVSGSSVSLGAALTLATVFFMLRNEYLLAAILAGVSALTFWQGTGLLIILVIDALMNSLSPQRGMKVAASVLLVGLVTWLPWTLFALVTKHTVGLPDIVPVTDVELPSLTTTVVLIVLGISIAIMAGISWREGGESGALLRNQLAPTMVVLWLGLSSWISGSFSWLIGLPICLALLVLTLRMFLAANNRGHLVHGYSFLVIGVLLVLFQLDFYRSTKPCMQSRIASSNELMAIAYWIRSNVPVANEVNADSPWILAYYSGRRIDRVNDVPAMYVVSSVRPDTSYKPVYDPVKEYPDQFVGSSDRWRLWRRM